MERGAEVFRCCGHHIIQLRFLALESTKGHRAMLRVSLITCLLAGCTTLTGVTASWAQGDCERVLVPFNAALTRADLRAIITAAQPILNSVECPAETRKEVGIKVALAHVREAEQIKDPAQQLTMLEKGMTYGQPWKMMKLIGDLRRKVPTSSGSIDYGAASLAYQSALADIKILFQILIQVLKDKGKLPFCMHYIKETHNVRVL